MTNPTYAAVRFEWSKLRGAVVVRVASIATLLLVMATSVGGVFASRYQSGTPAGAKTKALFPTDDWSGYAALAGLSLGITLLLASGVVISWAVGREFSDKTIVGLFAIPVGRGALGAAKLLALLGWGLLLAAASTVGLVLGGLGLGFPLPGAGVWAVRMFVVGALVVLSMFPMAWCATVGRGYLTGIAATLGVVVVTNLATGFGAGQVIPWSIAPLWVSGQGTPAVALLLPLAAGGLGVLGTVLAWSRLQLR